MKLLGYMMGGILGTVDTLQHHFLNYDILQSHFHLISDAVLILNVHHSIVKANKAFLQLTGVRSLE